MSYEKTYTPKQERFWGFGQREEKCSIKEKAEIEHTYKALEIVAESQGKDITEQFTQFYRECTYLRALCGWDSDIEEEEKVEEPEEEGEVEEFDNTGATPNLKKLRFIEIMLTDYNQITEDMKEEAIKLFPEVISEVGNFGEHVSCDCAEVFK